jgi:NAD-reducing hydrogenase small subunit
MSFLDLDEALIDILDNVVLCDTPITDFKDFNFSDVDVGIIEGAIANEEELKIARKLRQHAKVLVAWGDCAVFGGINTLRNTIPKETILRRGFIETESTVDGVVPFDEELPVLLDKAVPVNYHVTVDAYVPGCPPSPEAIAYSLKEILEGRIPVLPSDMIHYD